MNEPRELRVGHLLLDPGDGDNPARIWVVVGYEGHGQKTCKLRTAGFGEAANLKVQADRIPPGWKFVHSELLAGLLGRHALTFDAGSEIDCAVCAVFGGPGTVEAIQKEGHRPIDPDPDRIDRLAAEADAERRKEVGISGGGVDLTRSMVCKAGEHARCKMPVCQCSCHGEGR